MLAARESLAGPASRSGSSIDPDVPEVRADAAQLERAFANLLENARRYSGAASPSRSTSGARRSRVLVRVVDRGPGIAPSERERIFEPFYRGPQASREPWTGSGLGLAIAKGFVEANGGTISVESLPGQGTSVRRLAPDRGRAGSRWRRELAAAAVLVDSRHRMSAPAAEGARLR